MSGLLISNHPLDAGIWSNRLGFTAGTRSFSLPWAEFNGLVTRVDDPAFWGPARDPESGVEVALGGRIPVNVSGGLLSKGHPLGATGIANIYEVATHLRGEAGKRQVEGARIGLTHVIGLGSACGIHILEKVA